MCTQPIPTRQNEQTNSKNKQTLDAHADKLPKDDLLVACQALSELIDSEDFQTFEEQYLPESSGDRLATFKNRFLGPFLDDYDTRKTIQPLLRQIQDLNY